MESKREHNFKTCYDGLACVGKALLPYTEGGLRAVFQGVYRQLAGLPLCTDRCSETHGNRTRSWCNTCNQWKMKLERYHRRSYKIPWQQTKSWTWPYAWDNIVDVFMPPGYNATCNLCDLSAACSVLKNCTEFKVNPNITRRVADLRNKYYGHNVDHKVSDRNKAKMFDVLKDLIRDPDVQVNINYLECYDDLCAIETYDDKYARKLSEIDEKVDSLTKNTTRQNELLKEIDQNVERNGANLHMMKTTQYRRQDNIGYDLVRNVLLAIIVLIILLCIPDMWRLVHHGFGGPLEFNSSQTDCISDTFKYPFPQDLPLLPYIREHKQMIGREWLLQEVEQSVLQTKQNKRGLTVVAEMGYGKSAFVSHILCANQRTSAWNLRRHTNAFHICKFDVPSTRNVGRFIRRLIGFFSAHSVQYGSEIAQLGESSLIYNGGKCTNEPIACLDQGVIFPLSKIQSDTPWLIVIDALDECYDHDADKNHILILLSNRMKRFPHWVHFLIFSRNIKEINKLKYLPALYLNASDPRNIKDIEDYLDSQQSFLERVNELFGKESKVKILKQLLKASEGNFLFITYSIEQALDNVFGAKGTLPFKLSDFYESNFERQFPTETDFRISKMILQVVCASFNPLSKSDIQNILHVNNITDINLINQDFRKLSFFLRIEKEITFVHKSIHDWLISKENSQYQIYPEKGHAYLSHYLMQRVAMNRTLNFVKMTIHVGKSKQKNIRKIYKSLKHEYLDIPANAIHQLVNLTDSVVALKLALPFVQKRLNVRDNGLSPAFLAAMNGHTEQLKLLIESGSDINSVFHIRSIEWPFGGNMWESVMKMVGVAKRHYLGYTLLHIATFHNNLGVVMYLLQMKPSLMHVHNHAGQLPSDIACEFGFKEILSEFLALKSTTVGDYCTYLAAKNGHIGILELITDMNCDCISDMYSVAAFDDAVSFEISYFEIKHFDKWWKVFKESPLHVAVRKGHTSVVEILSKRCPGMLNCKDTFGRTPFLACIWYNQQNIFELLLFRLKQNIVETCTYNPLPDLHNKLTLMFSHNYLGFVDEKQCPDGFSVAHVLAKFDRFDMILYMLKTNVLTRIDWSLLDKAGYPPEHYAACTGNNWYLLVLKRGYLPGINVNKRRYKDGRTVFHSAALCGQYTSILFLKGDNFAETIPISDDQNGRGVLIYSVLKRLKISDDETQISHTNVVAELSKDGHPFDQTDSDGRNVLHHSLISGYYMVSYYIYTLNVSLWLNLFQQQDMKGKTPIEISITENSGRSRFILPQECSFFHILTTYCHNDDTKHLMSPWEWSITHTMMILYDNQTKYLVPSYLLPSIFINSPYITTAVLTYCQNTEEDLNRQLKRTMRLKLPFKNYFRYSIISIAGLKPAVLHKCNQHFHNSPLHKIVYLNDNTLADKINLQDIIYLIRTLHTNPACPDIRGFNILHYALMGGRIDLASDMKRSGFPVINKRVQHVDIPWMALLARFMGNTLYADCIPIEMTHSNHSYGVFGDVPFRTLSQISCSDEFLSKYITLHHLNFEQSDFCVNNTATLSLIHLLAFHGMLKTLTVVRDNYGYDVLSCITKDGFTPKYMWCLYNEDEQWSLIVKKYSDVKIPNIIAEKMLLYLLGHSRLRYISVDPFKCMNNYVLQHRRFSVNRYNLRHCIEELSLLSLYDDKLFFDDRLLKERNLIARVTHFFDDFLTFGTILENNTFTCYVINHFFKSHLELKRFILHHEELFHHDGQYGRLVQYVVRSFKSLKRGDDCRVFMEDSWRIKRLKGILDRVVTVIIPDIASACFRRIVVTNPYIHDFQANKFLKYRLSKPNLRQYGLYTLSGKQPTAYLHTLRQRFKNLYIVKKTLLYQQMHKYNTPLDNNNKNILNALKLLRSIIKNQNVFY